jgi:hypothetical protein
MEMDMEIISVDDIDFTLDDALRGRIPLRYEIIPASEIAPGSYQLIEPEAEGFSGHGTYKANGGYRDYWSEKDWDFAFNLMLVKAHRAIRSKRIIILDDYVEFRYLPSIWAENLCNELVNRGFKHMIDFKVYHDDTPRD